MFRRNMAEICVCLKNTDCINKGGVLTAQVGIFLFHPSIPNYPKAKFPGVVVFSEIYQGTALFRSIGGAESE